MIKSRAPGTPLVLTVTQDSVTDASDDAEEEANPSGGATAAAPTASKVCTHLPCRIGFVGAVSVSAFFLIAGARVCDVEGFISRSITQTEVFSLHADCMLT